VAGELEQRVGAQRGSVLADVFSDTSVGKVTVEMAVDESCPVCRTAEIVCGKWTLLLVRDLAEGCSRFCELERSLAGISPRTLSLRLRALEEEGIVERHTYAEVPPRVEYALTDKGLALLPIVEDMRAYGERWLGLDCVDAAKAALGGELVVA
jgi:DNA-binding HxlR family transcriptional regulator